MILVISISQSVVGEFPPSAALFQDQGTKIRKQDQSGPYVIETLDRNRAKKEAEIRDFIWSHWRQKRSGRLVATWYSKEGVPAETAYVLEPDEKGVWSMKVTMQSPPARGSDPEHDRSEYRVYSVRRIEPRHDGQSPAVFIPDDKSRQGESYWLVFYSLQHKKTGGL
jgi:hypothetical protein